jgi:hypothetical protein
MKSWHYWYITLVVIALITFVTGYAYPEWVVKGDDTYTVSEVFYSEGDYQKFKEAVIPYKDNLTYVMVLSSAPPIVVKMDVEVPYNQNFGYGIKNYVKGGITGIVMLVLFVIGLVIILPVWVTTDDSIKGNK